jgi:putative acetyltransferase
MNREYIVTEASVSDALEISRILRAAFDHNLAFIINTHTPQEDEAYIRDQVFSKCTVAIAKDGNVIAGYCAYREGWIEHLYVLPKYQQRGIGPRLLAKAKEHNTELHLWTFQKNKVARKFYESGGFVIAEETNGEGNEEKEPDIRYQWEKAV